MNVILNVCWILSFSLTCGQCCVVCVSWCLSLSDLWSVLRVYSETPAVSSLTLADVFL